MWRRARAAEQRTRKLEKGLAAAERQLGNEAFMAKAPAHIVDGLRKQAAETKMLHERRRLPWMRCLRE